MRVTGIVRLFLSALLIAAACGFQVTLGPKARPLVSSASPKKGKPLGMSPFPLRAIPRGGGIIAMGTAALRSGPFGVVSLWAIASAVVIPMTMYRQGYSFSVGYGFAVMAMGLALLQVFQPTAPLPSTMLVSIIFYGFRLGAYLMLRDATVPSKAEQIKAFDKSPRLQRIPMALSVALFYAFITTPALYACRAAETIPTIVSTIGAGMAALGAALEAIADTHKYIVKRSNEQLFVGPTGGVYRISRHPNYLGELLFWTGVFVAGAPTFGKSIVAWVASLLGIYGIFGIMTNATNRLDKTQAAKYKGQAKYEAYKLAVKAPLFPFID